MVTSLSRSLRQDKLAIAIGTFHLRPGPHFEEDAGVAERAAVAITGDAVLVDYDDFWRRCRHGENGPKALNLAGSYRVKPPLQAPQVTRIASAHSFR